MRLNFVLRHPGGEHETPMLAIVPVLWEYRGLRWPDHNYPWRTKGARRRALFVSGRSEGRCWLFTAAESIGTRLRSQLSLMLPEERLGVVSLS